MLPSITSAAYRSYVNVMRNGRMARPRRNETSARVVFLYIESFSLYLPLDYVFCDRAGFRLCCISPAGDRVVLIVRGSGSWRYFRLSSCSVNRRGFLVKCEVYDP